MSALSGVWSAFVQANTRNVEGTARQSRNRSAMAILAMLRHGQDARGTKSVRHAEISTISSTGMWVESATFGR